MPGYSGDPWDRPVRREPACGKCGARGQGHYVSCPLLGKSAGATARDPKLCPNCHIEHNGECF